MKTTELSCPRAKLCAHGATIRMTASGDCADCGTTLRSSIHPYKRNAGNDARAVAMELSYQGYGR